MEMYPKLGGLRLEYYQSIKMTYKYYEYELDKYVLNK